VRSDVVSRGPELLPRPYPPLVYWAGCVEAVCGVLDRAQWSAHRGSSAAPGEPAWPAWLPLSGEEALVDAL
jgi:hypothetical protein